MTDLPPTLHPMETPMFDPSAFAAALIALPLAAGLLGALPTLLSVRL